MVESKFGEDFHVYIHPLMAVPTCCGDSVKFFRRANSSNISASSPVDAVNNANFPLLNRESIVDASLLGELEGMLIRLGYAQEILPPLVTIFNNLFRKINFKDLRQEAQKIRLSGDPKEFDRFFLRLNSQMKENYKYFILPQGDRVYRESVLTLLVKGLIGIDIFEMLRAGTPDYKEKKLKKLFQCSARTQLGYILVSLLGFSPQVVETKGHVFLAIVDSDLLRILDFGQSKFLSIPQARYFTDNGVYLTLKETVPFPLVLFRIREFLSRKNSALYALYRYFPYDMRIQNKNIEGAELMMRINVGSILLRLGKFEEARVIYEGIIKCDPQFATAYLGLGWVLKELHLLQ
jgi:tetratricopeptide (TPR) repeat protein